MRKLKQVTSLFLFSISLLIIAGCSTTAEWNPRTVIVDGVTLSGGIKEEQKHGQINKKIKNAYTFGLELLESKDYSSAIRFLKEAIHKNPNNHFAHFHLGVAYEKLLLDNQAIEEYKVALMLEPRYSLARESISRLEGGSAHENSPVQGNNYAELYDRGVRFLDSGNYSKAITSFEEYIRINPSNPGAHHNLGYAYSQVGWNQEAIDSYLEVIRIDPDNIAVYRNLGIAYDSLGKNREAIDAYKNVVRIKPNDADAHYALGLIYEDLGRTKKAIDSYRRITEINPNNVRAHYFLGSAYDKRGDFISAIASFLKVLRLRPNRFAGDALFNLGAVYADADQFNKAIASYQEYIRIYPTKADGRHALGLIFEELTRNDEAIRQYKEALRIDPSYNHARISLKKIQQKVAQRKPPPTRAIRPPSPKEPAPQHGSTGSGFFVSRAGHVITNAHVVKNCTRITIGENVNKQVPAELISKDRSNDLALLKLSTLELASAESKSLIQKLSIAVVPLASKGLLRSEDARLGEKVLVAGYPFGDQISNTIKVTTGVVSATRGLNDNSGEFQLDAAVQPGNSGGPIYDSSGNILGVVVSGLNKIAMAKTRAYIPENVNFGIKASTVKRFLATSGLPSKKSERTEEKSTEQLAKIAQNQTLMVMCLQ